MIEMPSGWRSSAPSPKPMASGRAPSIAARVVIRIGRKRRTAAWWIAVSGDRPSRRSRSSATSIIMMAFFFTMPISSSTPIMAMMLSSTPVTLSASRAPTPADGRVDRIVSGWM